MKILNLNRFEAHDRLLHVKKEQSVNVFQGAEDCLKKNPLSLAIQEKSPYLYIFGHARTGDDGYTKVLYWQPRLSRPTPQTNSYLFRAQSKTDIIEICWIIPPRELWDQYAKGKISYDETIEWSINQYRYMKKDLSMPHPDDMSEEQGQNIFKKVLLEHEQSLQNKKIIKLE